MVVMLMMILLVMMLMVVIAGVNDNDVDSNCKHIHVICTRVIEIKNGLDTDFTTEINVTCIIAFHFLFSSYRKKTSYGTPPPPFPPSFHLFHFIRIQTIPFMNSYHYFTLLSFPSMQNIMPFL